MAATARRTQRQRLRDAPSGVKQRFSEFRAIFGDSVDLQYSANISKKATFDAIQRVRRFLVDAGIHDFSGQGLTQANHGAFVPTVYVSVEDGRPQVDEITTSFFVPPTGGGRHKRFNPYWGASRPEIDDYLSFGRSGEGKLVIFNASRGLPEGALRSSPRGLLDDVRRVLEDAAFGPLDLGESQMVDEVPDFAQIRTTSQGVVADALLRKAIEDHAVQVAIAAYKSLGAREIREVGKPYDLELLLDGATKHVEVKGSLNRLDAVSLTKNEVAHASSHDTDLFVVDEITVLQDDSGAWLTEAGRVRRWTSWVPTPDSLTARVYDHRLQSLTTQLPAAVDEAFK